ncbi:MAG: helix-turn-helix domain-containing protein, partial [Myxococcales bacterium]
PGSLTMDASSPPPSSFPAAEPTLVADAAVPGSLDTNEPGVASLASLASLSDMAAQVRAAHLANAPAPNGTGNTPTPILQFPIDLPTMLRELETRYINAALAQTGSNKKEAAKLLGMGRTTLVEKLRRRASDRPDEGPDGLTLEGRAPEGPTIDPAGAARAVGDDQPAFSAPSSPFAPRS